MAPDPRKWLAQGWEQLTEEQHEELRLLAMEAWRESLTATKEQLVKGYEIICKDCRQKRIYDIPVRIPDVLVRAKVFEIYANQAFGKVPERKHVEVDLGAQTLEALNSMSTLELARMAGVEEAEWAELPPAA